MEIIFEWDPIKATQNQQKHRITFERAATIFLDPNQISVFDAEHSDSEDRWATIGVDQNGILLVVIHTYTSTSSSAATIRIISARKASRLETFQYQGTIL